MIQNIDLKGLVSAQIDQWQSGERPDAAAFLSAHPEVQGDKSLAMDLIYEEYRLRTVSGDTLVKSTFCDQFPAYRRSVAKMFEVNEYLDQCPQLPLPPREADWPQPGLRFRGYDIVQPLGRGALARVYLAQEAALGKRLVVIKVSRFGASEAETMGRLAHDNIVPIHSVQHDSVSGWTVICMPVVGTATGIDLLDAASAGARAKNDGSVVARVGKGARPLDLVAPPPGAAREARQWQGTYGDAIARFGWHLAEGLAAAHAKGVEHRDLKPSNILLAWSGRPMLLDFNLSADVEAQNMRFGGTLAYMAPEQIAVMQQGPRQPSAVRSADATIDPRPDIYSLGVVLYELLTGQLPARPADADQLPLDAWQPWRDSKAALPPAICELSPQVDPRLAAIVMKCLAFDPAQRYATAADLAADLQGYLRPAPAARRYVQRNWKWLTPTALATVAIVLAIAAFVASLPSREQQLGAAAHAELRNGNYAAAEKSFSQLLQFNPNSPEYLFARAQANRLLKRWPAARADYVRLADIDRSLAWAMAGVCDFSNERDLRAALDDFDKATRAGVTNRTIVLLYGYTARKANENMLALTIYNRILQSDPDDYLAIRGRASAYMWLATSTGGNGKLHKQAVKDVEKLCAQRPDTRTTLDFALVVLNRAAGEYALEPQQEALATRCLERLLAAVPPPDNLATREGFAKRFRHLKELLPNLDCIELQPTTDLDDPEPKVEGLLLPETGHLDDFRRQF